MDGSGTVTDLLRAWRRGDEGARDALVPLVYRDLHRRAAAYLRAERPNHTLQPTGLVHEAYVRLVGQDRITWQNRAQFLGVAARMMRRILIDGKELFFRQGDSPIAVTMVNGAAVGKPELLFSAPSLRATSPDRTNYDVTPDGQRFVMIRREPEAPRIQVWLNWADELRRRVPR
jgi:hypothetical protein